MREPGPMTVLPDVVVSKRTGDELELSTPEVRALTVAIGEDFLEKGLHGATDVVSAAFQAKLTLDVLAAAGLEPVDAEQFVHLRVLLTDAWMMRDLGQDDPSMWSAWSAKVLTFFELVYGEPPGTGGD